MFISSYNKLITDFHFKTPHDVFKCVRTTCTFKDGMVLCTSMTDVYSQIVHKEQGEVGIHILDQYILYVSPKVIRDFFACI